MGGGRYFRERRHWPRSLALALCALLLYSMTTTTPSSFIITYAAAAPGNNNKGVNKKEEEAPDYYAVLGLESKREDATEREIKTSWRKLSKQFHPDLAGEEARAHYQTIQRAYEILGDRRKRKIYDILGEEGLQNMNKPQAPQEMNWIFQAFGGGAAGGAGAGGGDMDIVLVVSLEDLYSGAAHTVSFGKVKICRSCRGTGAKSKDHIHTCPHCQGRGSVLQNVQLAPGFTTRMEQPCPRCNGKGKTISMLCPTCSGKKKVRGSTMVSVDVEAGMPEGHVITFELEADQEPGQIPGDLRVHVESAPHPRFVRRDLHLYTNVTLTLKEALLGFERSLAHLDGRRILLESSGVTQHEEVTRVREEGMPRHHVPSEKGDLFVTFNVELPRELTEEQRKMIREIF